jgi:hypothetical protein
MRSLIAVAVLLSVFAPGLGQAQSPAQSPAPAAPRPLGTFQSWTAATHNDGGKRICYAFTRASRSEGVPGRNAQDILLLVTHRPAGRDQVAVRSGYNFGRGAELRLVIGPADLSAYTNQDNAFLRDGRAAVTAMRNGREAQARAPGPNGRGTAQDIFPLAGFSAAYEAISRECPPTAPPRR